MRIWLLILSIAFSGSLYGYNIGVTAGALLFMERDYQLTHVQAAWFVSAFFWGICASILFIGYLSDRIGRRKMLLVAPLILALATVYMVWYPSDIDGLIIARFINGIGVAIIAVNVPLYLSEIAAVKVRGRATAAFQLSLCLGILFASAISLFHTEAAHWQDIFLYALIPCLVLLIASIVMPESPRWLLLKNQPELAKQALNRFNDSDAAAIIYDRIISTYHKINKLSWRDIISQRSYVMAIILVIAICSLNQLTGINSVLQYDAAVFVRSGIGEHKAALLGTLLVAGINFIATVVAMLFIDKIERRKILAVNLIGLVVSLSILALISWAMPVSVLKSWLILGAVLMFIIFFAIGPGALVWTLAAELLPLRISGRAMAVAQCFSALAGAISTAIFLPLSERWGFGSAFSVCALFSIIYLWVALKLPDTHGKQLEEIHTQ